MQKEPQELLEIEESVERRKKSPCKVGEAAGTMTRK